MLDRLRALLQGPSPDPSDDRPRAQTYAAIGLLCAAGGLTGYLFVPDAQAHAAVQIEARLMQRPLASEGDVRALALAAAREYLRAPITLNVGPWEFKTTRGRLGAKVDLASLSALIQAARDERSPLRRLHLQELGDAPLELPVPARLDPEAAQAWLLRVKDQVYQRARDARVDLRTGKIVREQPGLALDVQGTLDVLDAALFAGQTTVQAHVVRAPVSRTERDLADLDLGTVLGTFESRYNALDADRSYNLRVAARHVDGIVLMPGEVFDFNAIVGERSEANGFRPAPVIAGGELTDGVGGGTCQIAGTLHAAVFFAGLPFLERNPHTRPSAYLKLGLDATVAYPKLNFKFRNDLPHPIAIGVTVGSGRVHTEIRGPGAAQREVSFVRRVDAVTPYTEVRRDDPSLPRGVKVLGQRGVPGFEVTSFRIVRDVDTQQVRRERREDRYPATTQIWRVGTGPTRPGFVPPAGDQHTEYRADEYLVLTMGPGIEGLQETVRREGKSGAPGWTARAGMPQAP